MLDIRVDDVTDPRVVALLHAHLHDMSRHSPAGSIHALDLDGLRAPDLTFWCAWRGDALAGCGALKDLGEGHGEIKSMRTHAAHLRQGVAAALLAHAIDVATARGWRRLSLETGTAAAFEPAHRLYARFDFAPCGPFGSYVENPWSTFMTRALAPA
ncbi:GNAT family N-acetyltransferase [Luteimonas sp. BDR2-5]|nr:GNAT family N-acetyltransferase [Luteimonas sp. BDR2-5]MCD9027371.1 GNAT family N-acetyltransferase [Luteimonas sp. BDR2-5]